MKKQTWIFVFALFAGFSCQNTLNTEAEKEALIAVNEEERDAYFDRDLSRLEAIWIQGPEARRVFAGTNAILELDGWQEIYSNYEGEINNEEMWDKGKDVWADFSNYDIQVFGKSAVIHHDIHWTGTFDGDPVDTRVKRITTMVRKGAAWKICSIVHMAVPEGNTAENKRTAAVYHALKEENIDQILTEDFIGRSEKDHHTWNRDDHHDYLGNGVYKKDSIFHQVA